MTEHDYRTQILELGASLFMRGYSVGGAGNMSVRLADGNILATPTNSCLGRLDADELSLTDADGRLISGLAPTKELPLHLAVYKARPGCGAVVHLHSTHATALSCLEDLDPDNALAPFTPYYVMKIGRLPVIPYHRPGDTGLGACASAMAHNSGAFLLANHGSVVCGATLVDAVNNAEELEETIKLYFLLLSSGRPIRYLSQKETAELTPAKAVHP